MERVRYACVGCGAIANNYHLPALARIAEAEFAIACDLDHERARATAATFGAQETASDCRLVVARDDIDLVCVFTKVDAHAEIAIAACEAGRHVFVQKPFARSVAEGRAMVAAARGAGVQLIPAFMHRYFDESLLAAQLVREGAIGDIEFMRQRNATSNPRGTVASYGGAMMDIGAHGIDLVRAITGEEIVRVAARLQGDEGGGIVRDDDVREQRDLRGGELSAFMLHELASGATVSHEVQWSQAAGASRFTSEVYGTGGTILLRAARTDADLAYATPAEGGRVEWLTPELPGREMGAAQHETVIHSLLTGDRSAQPPGDGLAVLRVCEAARQSMISGCREHVLD